MSLLRSDDFVTTFQGPDGLKNPRQPHCLASGTVVVDFRERFRQFPPERSTPRGVTSEDFE